jgi:membrane protein
VRAFAEAFQRLRGNRSDLAAAGCAFYAMLSLFPAITLLLLVYGLAFDLRSAEPQLGRLGAFLPADARALVLREVHGLVVQPHRTLGLGAALGALFTLWGAANGTRAMLAALAAAYSDDPRPRGWRPLLLGLAMTLAVALVAALGLGVLVALPPLLRDFGFPPGVRLPLHGITAAGLAGFVALFFAALYRFGPPPRRREVRLGWPGTLLATLLWLAASSAFSAYIGGLAGLGVNFGPAGATVGLLLWFYVSAWVTLLGAELNAALERARAAAARPQSEP